jgi:hypothetical protein
LLHCLKQELKTTKCFLPELQQERPHWLGNKKKNSKGKGRIAIIKLSGVFMSLPPLLDKSIYAGEPNIILQVAIKKKLSVAY